MTPERYAKLAEVAETNDVEAVWEMYNYYALDVQDPVIAGQWLRRAARLRHPEGQRWLASDIKEYDGDFTGFGPSEQAAVKSLLEQASRTNGEASFELATTYAEGYFGRPDYERARFYFVRGAQLHNRSCWKELSRYCKEGLGGPRDNVAAYYWISLETQCVDPESVSGREAWTPREKMAERLSMAALERQWGRIDAFMAEVKAGTVKVDETPFLDGGISADLGAAGRRRAAEREIEHRQQLRTRKS